MDAEKFKKRTKSFAVEVIDLVEGLPKDKTSDVVGRQLLKSATSVAANYRSACRARSAADFVNKMGIVEEESDESIFWLELLTEKNKVASEKTKYLIAECDEILSMTVSSIRTARKRS